MRRRDAFLELMTSSSAAVRWSSSSSDDAPYVYSQGGQVLFHHCPDCININIEVGMEKAVSRSCDLPQRNIRFTIGQRFDTVRASARMRCLRAGCNSRSVQRSTFTPSASSRSSCRPTIWSKEVPSGRSTNKSRSLPSWSCPLAAEPKTRTRLAPRAAANASISSRLNVSDWEGSTT